MVTLAADITASDRILRVSGDVTAATEGGLYTLDDELLVLDGFLPVTPSPSSPWGSDRTAWRVQRGARATAAVAHSAGTGIYAARVSYARSDTLTVPPPVATTGAVAGPHVHAEADVTGLTVDLVGKAPASHAHDYATTGHAHATYASDTHNHDASYAPTHAHPYSGTAHNHDAAYSGTAHAHDAAYSTVAHTHASYATTSHNHDAAYAAAVHAHAAAAPTYALLANGTTALALGTNDAVKVTPTGNATLTTTVPASGKHVHVIVLTSGVSSFTLTFGTGFKPVGTLATGTTTARVFVVGFISDGTNLYETGRTAAMVA